MDLLIKKKMLKPLPLPEGGHFACQLYVDDNYNVVQYQRDNIRHLLKLYENFCKVSGSKIALHKTECLVLSYDQEESVLDEISGMPNWTRDLCPPSLQLV